MAAWFILNLGEMAWETVPGFGVWCGFDGPEPDSSKPRVGVHVHVLKPGEANGYYHAEAAQEGFLVLSGECIAIVRAWSAECDGGTTCTPRKEPPTSRSVPARNRARS